NGLYGVAAVAPDDVWAVGYYYSETEGIRRGMVEHWDGERWATAPNPVVGTHDYYLASVSALSANDVWAAGYSRIGGTNSTLVEHWDGSRWSIVPSANAGRSSAFNAIAPISANDIWSAGFYWTGAQVVPLDEHRDGS